MGPSRVPPVPHRGAPPDAFRIERGVALGRHPLLTVFPGLDQLGAASRLTSDPSRRDALWRGTFIDLVAEDLWMYVAPWTPIESRRGPRPTVAPGTDCVVIGASHLRESPALVLYLDIFHELVHVLQRHAGADLFPPGVEYVDRPTEVEAYRFVVEDARRLGVDDATLREYLLVEWIDRPQFLRLLAAVGVPPPPDPP
ncbi:MAG: hypothetical protein ACREDK_02890 [Thermoplasmata archaeon]